MGRSIDGWKTTIYPENPWQKKWASFMAIHSLHREHFRPDNKFVIFFFRRILINVYNYISKYKYNRLVVLFCFVILTLSCLQHYVVLMFK